MAASDVEVNPAQFLIILQIRTGAALRPVADVIGENAGEEEGMIADMGADVKGGAVIGGLQSGQHFKEIIQRAGLAGGDQPAALLAGELGEQFGDVIGDGAVLQARGAQDMAHQDVKIKVAGDAQAAALFEEGVKQGVVIEDQIARFGIGQRRDQGGRVVLFPRTAMMKAMSSAINCTRQFG